MIVEAILSHLVYIISKNKTVLLMAKELYETVIPQTRYVIYEEKSSQYFHVGPTLPWRTDMMLVNSLLGSRYQKGR